MNSIIPGIKKAGRSVIDFLYAQVWYHVQFWVDKRLRRPFTYVFRDFLHQHLILGIFIRLGIVTGIIFLCRWNWAVGAPAAIVYGFILGHIDWGGYKPGQQEDPEYIEE